MTQLKGWLHLHRQFLFTVAGVAIVAGPVVSVIYVKVWNWPRIGSEQIALVGVVATIAAAYLAFLAAAVALLAFIVADETPHLEVTLNNETLDAGFDLEVAEVLRGGRRIAAPAAINIRFRNTTNFSARNPVVRLEIKGALLNAFVEPWRRVGDFGDGTYFWQGGPSDSIHGGMPYVVPPFGLAGNDSWAEAHVAISIEVAAEGFHLGPHPIAVQVGHP